MKAVVFHGIGDIRLEEVKEPKIKDPTDAIVRITASAICGTDLHMIRGTMPGMEAGTILGHEGVGIIEEVGSEVRNLVPGDRVVIPSTIACGSCSYCRSGYQAQCDHANPNGSQAGTAFFGGPKATGPFDGLQAEYARVPYANVGLVKLPSMVTDEQAILCSDIFPTGYFGAEMAEIKPGDTVAVFGCGPVGLFAILSAQLLGASRVLAVDRLDDRLEVARRLNAEVINFEHEDPVEAIHSLTRGIGVDRCIDAVGIDSEAPKPGPAGKEAAANKKEFEYEVSKIAKEGTNPDGKLWTPGSGPSQAFRWEVECLAKAGTLSVIGVYPETDMVFPIGKAMMKNLAINMGNCHHRRYIPRLIEYIRIGRVSPAWLITQQEPLTDVITAYQEFDQRRAGWVKVELVPKAAGASRA